MGVVGMHPDQATEPIVDFALAHGVSFAVVPCCVYANEFPQRKHPETGLPVSKYEDFVRYLCAKDPRIREAELNFEGRNRVVYLDARERVDHGSHAYWSVPLPDVELEHA